MPIVVLCHPHEANGGSCLHFLPSPLEGEGLGVRGLSSTAPQLVVWCTPDWTASPVCGGKTAFEAYNTTL